MNRNEAIEKSAQLFLQVLEHNDNRLTDAVYESINNLREALAMPKDAEPWSLQDVELYRMQMSAISVITFCNTRESFERCKIDKNNQYWTSVYEDVAQSVLREIVLLEKQQKADAERVALLERIDNHMEDNSDLFDLLRDIRAYLQGSA